MPWVAWSMLCASAVLALGVGLFGGARRSLARIRLLLTLVSGLAAVGSAILGSIAWAKTDDGALPFALVLVTSVLFGLGFGGPFTELIFRLAARKNASVEKPKTDPSPLRGGLWIGLLERSAITATLWAGWPEGIAIVLAVKGLGRFSELKNHQAAEQFILGTFSSCLVAAASYGLGLLLLS